LDDEIFEHAIATFPEFNAEGHEKLVRLDEESLKSDEGKKKWRDFINQCVHLVICDLPNGATYPCILAAGTTCVDGHSLDDSVIARYETKVKDFNFGSLIRMDATKEYSETNTIFGRFQSITIDRVCVLTCVTQ
jgi:replication fork protection complex subunit Tof1/Swi1